MNPGHPIAPTAMDLRLFQVTEFTNRSTEVRLGVLLIPEFQAMRAFIA